MIRVVALFLSVCLVVPASAETLRPIVDPDICRPPDPEDRLLCCVARNRENWPFDLRRWVDDCPEPTASVIARALEITRRSDETRVIDGDRLHDEGSTSSPKNMNALDPRCGSDAGQPPCRTDAQTPGNNSAEQNTADSDGSDSRGDTPDVPPGDGASNWPDDGTDAPGGNPRDAEEPKDDPINMSDDVPAPAENDGGTPDDETASGDVSPSGGNDSCGLAPDQFTCENDGGPLDEDGKQSDHGDLAEDEQDEARNPGNERPRGNAGETPNGGEFGDGTQGRSDVQNEKDGGSGKSGGPGNPGNERPRGNAGESPNGGDFGGGSKGRSDADDETN